MFGFFSIYKLGEITANIIFGFLLFFAIIGIIATIKFFVTLIVRANIGTRLRNQSKNSNRNKYM